MKDSSVLSYGERKVFEYLKLRGAQISAFMQITPPDNRILAFYWFNLVVTIPQGCGREEEEEERERERERGRGRGRERERCMRRKKAVPCFS